MHLQTKLLLGIALGVILIAFGIGVGYFTNDVQLRDSIMMIGYVLTISSMVIFFFTLEMYFGAKVMVVGFAIGFLGHIIHLTLGTFPKLSNFLYGTGDVFMYGGFIIFMFSVVKTIKIKQ